MDLVSASRIALASTVKRLAWRAGASRITSARSARVSAWNNWPCNPSITRSTTDWMNTAWPYCATDLAQVTAMMIGGTSQMMRSSPAVNRLEACWITTGYSAVKPATATVQTMASAMPPRCRLTCSRHSRSTSARED